MGIDIEMRRLRFFVEVVRQGGFSQAAKIVFATQPTVSKAVKQLEDELGVVLLERLGHRSVLTAAGEVVYRRALGLLSEGENLIAELDELRGLKRGRLRLGCARLGSSSLFAPMFASFRRRYPGVEVELSVHDSKRLEEVLLAGELDLAALVHPIPQRFDWQDVRSEPLVALLARDHAIAGRSSQVDFIFELVAAGAGIAFLPRVLAEQRPHRLVRRVPLDEPQCEWRIALAWRRSGYLSNAARAWLAHAGEAAST